MSERNRQVVDRVNEAFALGSVERFLECCADDVEWTMIGEGTAQGKEAVREWMRSMEADPPRFLIEDTIEAGDRIVVCGTMSLDEDDDPDYAFCDIYRLRDGKVIELRSFVVDASEDEDDDDEEEEAEDED